MNYSVFFQNKIKEYKKKQDREKRAEYQYAQKEREIGSFFLEMEKKQREKEFRQQMQEKVYVNRLEKRLALQEKKELAQRQKAEARSGRNVPLGSILMGTRRDQLQDYKQKIAEDYKQRISKAKQMQKYESAVEREDKKQRLKDYRERSRLSRAAGKIGSELSKLAKGETKLKKKAFKKIKLPRNKLAKTYKNERATYYGGNSILSSGNSYFKK
jgi:hypothetical protein